MGFLSRTGITGYNDLDRLWHAGSQILTYRIMCPFSLFIALCNHNPPTLETDEQTDGRHARS